jgi:MFS family permease
MPDKEVTEPTARQMAGPFAALHFRDFRLFWIGLFISNIGTWMQMTATSWLLYELTDSPLQLGLNGIFRAVPSIGLGLFGGTMADRCDRKRLMLITQAISMLLAFALGFLAQTGMIRVWHIYALTALSAMVGTLDAPARQALYPSLIPASVLPNAIALNSLLWKGTALLGPSLAGIAISTVGTDGAFYANAVSFLAVVVALLLMTTPTSRAGVAGDFVKDLKEGVSYVLAQDVILAVMVMEAVSSVFGLDQAMLTIFARDILQVGASGLGFLQSARGLGAVVGSGVLISMGQVRSQGKLLLFSAIAYGVSFALFGLSRSYSLSLLMLLLAGATDTVSAAARNIILQVQTPDIIRGRVMGVFHLSNRGLHPLGQTRTGLVVPLLGAREATFLGGLLVAAATVLTAWRVPGLPRFRWQETEGAKFLDASSPEIS